MIEDTKLEDVYADGVDPPIYQDQADMSRRFTGEPREGVAGDWKVDLLVIVELEVIMQCD